MTLASLHPVFKLYLGFFPKENTCVLLLFVLSLPSLPRHSGRDVGVLETGPEVMSLASSWLAQESKGHREPSDSHLLLGRQLMWHVASNEAPVRDNPKGRSGPCHSRHSPTPHNWQVFLCLQPKPYRSLFPFLLVLTAVL